VSVVCLAIYDMIKAVERAGRIKGIRLREDGREVRALSWLNAGPFTPD
jgi:molybdenum cofactor biosynthesis enzyme